MPAPATTKLAVYKAWVLLLFNGQNQSPKLTEEQIAEVLTQARCETSAADVRAALKMWGELDPEPDQVDLRSPPTERASVSHTPLYPPKGISPFLHDGLPAYIELYGLPKGVKMPIFDSQPREERRHGSQMLDQFLESCDDPFVPAVVDLRERMRQAALAAGPLKVDPSQCSVNILEADEHPLEDDSDDMRQSPFYVDYRGRDNATYSRRLPRVHRSVKLTIGSRTRPSASRDTPASSRRPDKAQWSQEQLHEVLEDEGLHGGEDDLDERDAKKSAIHLETQCCQSHDSEFSSRKRMRPFSPSSTDEESEETNKKSRRDEAGVPENSRWQGKIEERGS